MKYIWGTGIAVKNNWILIKKYFNPDAEVDGNSAKWNKKDGFTGLMCYSPSELKGQKNVEVLITVGDPYAVSDIISSLNELNITNYTVLTDVLQLWGKSEELPRRLQITAEEEKFILFNTPEHDNIGDHLITVSTEQLLSKMFPAKRIVEVSDIDYWWYGHAIHEKVTPKDTILISGGGFLGSLWLYNGENNVRSIIEEYPENKIIILPQTMYFENSARGKSEYKKSCKIYRKHKELIVCVRDKESELVASSVLQSSDRVKLLPDMALFYDGFVSHDYFKREEKILVCLRTDKESVLSSENRKEIYKAITKIDYPVVDTSMHADEVIGHASREFAVQRKLNEISSARLVITDTLHCMISAAITGTPCIAFDNLSGKLSGVYQWIEGLEYIKLCRNIDEFVSDLEDISLANHEYRLMNRLKYEECIKHIILGDLV